MAENEKQLKSLSMKVKKESENADLKLNILFLFLFLFYFILFLFVVNFVIHWNETTMGLHVFPILIPPPTSLSTRSP